MAFAQPRGRHHQALVNELDPTGAGAPGQMPGAGPLQAPAPLTGINDLAVNIAGQQKTPTATGANDLAVSLAGGQQKTPTSIGGFLQASGVTPGASPFQSQNRSVGGFLQEAMGSKLGDIQKIGDEGGRKKFAEDYIRTLVPEVEARGGKVGDIRNEKIQIDGQWRDLVRDISGAADTAQFIVPDEGGPQMPMGGGMLGGMGGLMQGGAQLDAQLGGDPMARIQQALAQINQGGRGNLDALLKQLNGV